MAEFRQVPGGRETPQGELRPEVVEDEVPRSPGPEDPGGRGSSSSESKLSPREEEELDPRIQEELEHLNQASEEINQVELQLDEARTTYRRTLQESARKLNMQGSQLGSCIEKARPYYEARRLAKEAQQETQKAALRYERAVSMHNAAREMVFVAEQGVMADKNRLDPTWQEMLNHATCKVSLPAARLVGLRLIPRGSGPGLCWAAGPWCSHLCGAVGGLGSARGVRLVFSVLHLLHS
ncbi:SH3 domain-binding protein 5-like [Fukomys damarensis]|uniref:SH3 domain-binding protein 5-like n=1 Tax=Fukomys damarensis TaxID=885580 RepID=UPI00053FFB17|nr:SH3 domain-binding protein 5-like [Fukomys damarensis]XP_010628410.1 SH3 domain-binding protein 5-like [Fukomys damarensis]XP_010628419.1 SH3 domain-binding protein 5-like [Fukomys damarensis]XP_010628428.1 SH3 domain-binding protein 5-like [Fukomys damarensis]